MQVPAKNKCCLTCQYWQGRFEYVMCANKVMYVKGDSTRYPCRTGLYKQGTQGSYVCQRYRLRVGIE